MFYTTEREQIRAFFHQAWEKAQQNMPLEPLELQLVAIINQHPEYHELFSDTHFISQDFPAEFSAPNPYLHMTLHQAITEQITMNYPRGVTSIYKNLLSRFSDPHICEHKMMDCLSEIIWEAIQTNRPFAENVYLEKLNKL